jgi:AcrR family transcriptional regulator
MNVHSARSETVEDKGQAILSATLELVSQHGFHGTPMSSIAERAGVGAGTIYRYFKNKEDLINELFLHLKSDISKVMLEGFSPSLPPEKVFRTIWLNTFQYCVQNPAEMMFLEQYHNSPFLTPESEAAMLDILNPLVEYFEASVAAGVLKDMPFQMMSIFVYDITVSYAKKHINGALKMDEKTLELAVQASWDAVKGPGTKVK